MLMAAGRGTPGREWAPLRRTCGKAVVACGLDPRLPEGDWT